MKRLTIIFLIGSLFFLYSCRERVHCPAYPPDKVMYLPDKFAGSTMKYVSDDKTDSVLFQCSSLKFTDAYTESDLLSCSAYASQELTNDGSHIWLCNMAYKCTSPNAPTTYSVHAKISAFKIRSTSIHGYMDASEDPYALTEILPEWVSFNGRRYTNVLSCEDYDSRYKIYLANGYGLVQIEMKEENKIYYLE